MYTQFFNFRERPFKLLPDPVYLFLGQRHNEAMAHLFNAVSQGDGFVKIVGETGTGKTTICRSFMEKIEDKIEIAYIFNPKMDALQLLKTINDEFKIDSSDNSLKELIDILNFFLLKSKAKKKPAVLLIDEAQNLSAEILEQLRLLSNLETAKDRLLQIFLLGQPGLDDILDTPNLRQLTERITVSCYLTPLSHLETRAYILHRTQIASRNQALKFSRGAMKTIYRYSSGIPRLINIASDRALLVAFGHGKQHVNARIAKTAIRDLCFTGRNKGFNHHGARGPVLILSLFLTTLIILILYQWGLSDNSRSSLVAMLDNSISAIQPQSQEKYPPVKSVHVGSRQGVQTYKIIIPERVPDTHFNNDKSMSVK